MNAFEKLIAFVFPVQGRRCFEGLTFNGHDYRAENNLKIPTHTMPLRAGEDEVVKGTLREREFRQYYPDAIARMRAEEFEKDFENMIQGRLS